jgi:fucose 4-O-acetylase-like acetyltransferase
VATSATPTSVTPSSEAPSAAPDATVPDAPRPSRRDPWFDNAKYVLITFVVVGHVIGTFRQQVPGAGTVYLWMYAFHMPAFIFLAGYFSKGTNVGRRQSTALFSRILVPYLVFETLYSLWAWRLDGGEFEVSLLVPYWIMWFLLALFIWRLAAPHLQRLRYPVATSVAVALGAGLIPDLDRYLTLHRVLALLPFFVLGLVVRPQHLTILRRRAARPIAAVVLVGALPAAAWASDNLAVRWFYHRTPYVDLDAGVLEGLLTRGTLLVAGVVLSAALLALVPRRRTPFTALGGVSLYPYLLHGLLVMGLEAGGITDRITSVPAAVAATLLAVVATFLLSSRPLRWVARPFVAPPTDWLFQPARSDAPGDVRGGAPGVALPVGDERRRTSG